jgi:hypothetical protein
MSEYKGYKCDNTVKEVIGDFHVVADNFGRETLI